MVSRQLFCVTLTCVLSQTYGELQHQLLESVQDIVVRHFPPVCTLVVSYDTALDFYEVIAARRTNTLHPEDKCKCGNDLNIHSALLRRLHRHEKWPLSVYGPTYGNKQEDRHGGYIILVQGVEVIKQIRNQLTKLKATTGWNSRGYFVIVVMGDLNYILGNVLPNEILTEFWSKKLANVIVLLPALSDGTENNNPVTVLEVYTLFPYRSTSDCVNVTHASPVDVWVRNNSGEGRFLRNAPLFPHKIPQNLRGCSISVSSFELEPVVMKQQSVYDNGLEIRLLKLILSYLNLTAVFVTPPPQNETLGRHLLNDSWNEIISHVTTGRSDVAIGGLIIYNVSNESFDTTSSYLQQDITWYVPCAKTRPRWKSITMVFTTTAWLKISVICAIVSVFMWYLYDKHWKSSKFFQNNPQTFLTFLLKQWAILLGISVSSHIPNSVTIRTLFTAWILCSFALNTVYQTFLTTHLVDPGLEKQIETEEQLLQSGLELRVNPFYEDVYKDIFRGRYHKLIHCPNIQHCFKRLARKGDVAVLCVKLMGDYIGKFKYADSNGNPGYCSLQEKFTTARGVMYMQKGHPLLYYFNKIILRVLEGGLVRHWWTHINHMANVSATFSSKNMSVTAVTSDFQKFSMYHLQSAFYALGLGYVVSVGVFLCEIIIQFHK